MDSVSVRDLRANVDDALHRVEHGATFIVTKDGRSVAELRPLPRRSASAAELISLRRHIPPVDPAGLRADVDALTDPGHPDN